MIIRKRNSHKGSITLGIASLSLLSLASIGFATWVISGGDTKTAEGTIEVDAVSDNLYAIEIGDKPWKDSKENGKIQYGYDGTTLTSTSAWLSADNTESLSETLTFTVKNAYKTVDASSSLNDGYSISFTLVDTSESGLYSTAKEAGLVGELPSTTNSGITATPTQKTGTRDAEYTVTIKFTWGTEFGNQNPAKYAESKAAESESYWDLSNKSSFASQLNKVYKLNSCTFKLTITTSASNS